MSHFAQINDENVVVNIVVGNNIAIEGDEGYSWIVENLGGRWIKTSYNGNIRKNYAMVGGTYNEELDAFIDIQPFPDWTLNEETCKWEPPVGASTPQEI